MQATVNKDDSIFNSNAKASTQRGVNVFISKLVAPLIQMTDFSPKLIGIKKKIERREARREQKAEAAARLEMSIEKELLERLKKGVYGTDGIVNESQEAFSKALNELQEEEDEQEMELEEEEEQDFDEKVSD
jgi:hypothetical protein